MVYLLFIIGLFLLVKCADFLVDGGSRLATILGVSPLFIGLSIAALGTSAPEAAVSIKAAVSAHSSISFGNILGSNIANIGLVLGLAALLWSLNARTSTIKIEIPYSLFITIVLIFLVRDDWHSSGVRTLSRFDGGILIIFFFLYLLYLYRMARNDRKNFLLGKDLSSIEPSKKELLKASALTILGILGVIYGANLLVDNGALIAKNWGVSETMISVTIIAVGTSLPEAATSLIAAKKGESGIAIGNVVGSNIFNILFVLGITSLICPIQFSMIAFPDLLLVLGISIILLIFMNTKKNISRKEGGVLFLIYLAYIVLVILRR